MKRGKWFSGFLDAESAVQRYGLKQAEIDWKMAIWDEFVDDYDWGFKDYLNNYRIRNKTNA